MTAFCGTFAGQDTWVHWTVNPCILESVSSVLLICTAALVLAFQCRRIILLRMRHYTGSERIPATVVTFSLCVVALAASHGALLVAAIIFYIRGAARDPYELFNQAASFALWLSALVSAHALSTHLHLCRQLSQLWRYILKRQAQRPANAVILKWDLSSKRVGMVTEFT